MKYINRTARRILRLKKPLLEAFTFDLTWDEVMHDLDPDWATNNETEPNTQGVTA